MATFGSPGFLMLCSQGPLRGGGNFFDREAEMLEQSFRRRRGAESVDADNMAVQADILAPVVGYAGFDGHALATGRWQYAIAIGLRLAIEHIRARHRNDAGSDALRRQGASGLHRKVDFRAGGDKDQIERSARRIAEYVAAELDQSQLRIGTRLVREILAREDQARWAFLALDRRFPGDRTLDRITGT